MYSQGRENIPCRGDRRQMINPLRCPLVLFGILVGLAFFVHRYTPRQSSPGMAIVEESTDDTLRLRKTNEVHLTADVRSLTSAAPPLADSAAILPLVPDERPRPNSASPSRSGTGLTPLPPMDELPSVLAPTTPGPTGARLADPPTKATLPPIEELASSRFLPRNSGPVAVQMHRIVDGDTLRDLAARYLGDESRYLEIYEANRDLLRQPDLLPLGSKLRIPRP